MDSESSHASKLKYVRIFFCKKRPLSARTFQIPEQGHFIWLEKHFVSANWERAVFVISMVKQRKDMFSFSSMQLLQQKSMFQNGG